MDAPAAATDVLLAVTTLAAAFACARRGDRPGKVAAAGLGIVGAAASLGVLRFLDVAVAEVPHMIAVKAASFVGVPLVLLAWALPPRERPVWFAVGLGLVLLAVAAFGRPGEWAGLSHPTWFHLVFLPAMALLGVGRARPA